MRNNKLTLLKLLPPTEYPFLLHVKRAALATILDKTAHVPQPNMEPFTNFGWLLVENKVVPVPSILPAWPDQMSKNSSCGSLTGCNRNKKGFPCYIGSRCQGSERYCSIALIQTAVTLILTVIVGYMIYFMCHYFKIFCYYFNEIYYVLYNAV